ncbi:hypothetical protein [Streptomyces sp. HUAS ZL42]|uniref:hypothetical protein n=1 Tax=Streptomyces sp. HUAS ZL42 TaxID=3231715 RepID=UPI00345E2735
MASGQVLTIRFCPTGDGPWRLQAHTTDGAGRTDLTVEAWNLHPSGTQQEPLLARHGQDT